jgi:hypothetical protein
MSTPEGKVKAKIDKLLKSYQVWFYSPQAGPFGRSGIPDRVAIVNGRFIGIEAKADRTKKPTKLQDHCMSEIEHAGGKCFVVFDDDTLRKLEDYLVASR